VRLAGDLRERLPLEAVGQVTQLLGQLRQDRGQVEREVHLRERAACARVGDVQAHLDGTVTAAGRK
jgi:hypothetical protein